MKRYFIFTVAGAHTYIICTDGENFFVENNPSDDIVLKVDFETATNIAEKNSKDGVVYQVKEVPEAVSL